MTLAPFSFDRSGHLLAAGDGPELIVYDGKDLAPLWKDFCDGILVGVALVGGEVHAVDTDGVLTTWLAAAGERRGELRLDTPATGLRVAEGGQRLVLLETGIAVADAMGGVRRIPVPGATCAAFGPGAARALVGTTRGEGVLLDLETGETLGATSLGGAVADVAWSPDGRWAVAVGQEVLFLHPELDPEAAVLLRIGAEAPLRHLALNAEGSVLAVDDGERVTLFETWKGRAGGGIAYTREIGGIAFGPGNLLAVGLEYADADVVDVMSGKLRQTRSGLGRTREPWFPKVKVDGHVLRGAAMQKRTGGGPVATIAPGQGRGGADGPNWLLIIGAIIGVMVLCCVCSTVVTTVVTYLR